MYGIKVKTDQLSNKNYSDSKLKSSHCVVGDLFTSDVLQQLYFNMHEYFYLNCKVHLDYMRLIFKNSHLNCSPV